MQCASTIIIIIVRTKSQYWLMISAAVASTEAAAAAAAASVCHITHTSFENKLFQLSVCHSNKYICHMKFISVDQQ